MFNAPGAKIKKIAVVLFWIVVCSSVITSFIVGFDRYSYHTSFNAGLFFLFFLGIPLFQYVSTLFVVAFGELVENSGKGKLFNGEPAKECVTNPKMNNDGTIMSEVTSEEVSLPFVCTKCGTERTGWYNKCPECGSIGTIVRK